MDMHYLPDDVVQCGRKPRGDLVRAVGQQRGGAVGAAAAAAAGHSGAGAGGGGGGGHCQLGRGGGPAGGSGRDRCGGGTTAADLLGGGRGGRAGERRGAHHRGFYGGAGAVPTHTRGGLGIGNWDENNHSKIQNKN
jgi:hypothetical protein